jgi:hypothetical protein
VKGWNRAGGGVGVIIDGKFRRLLMEEYVFIRLESEKKV